MALVEARLFGPGLAPAGEAARLALDGATLHVTVASGMRRALPVAGMTLRRAGFDERGLELAWRDADGAWACQLLRPADVAMVLAALPSECGNALQGLRTGRARRSGLRVLGWSALAMFLAAPVLLLLLFFLAQDRIVDLVADRISVAAEERLGEASFGSAAPSPRRARSTCSSSSSRATPKPRPTAPASTRCSPPGSIPRAWRISSARSRSARTPRRRRCCRPTRRARRVKRRCANGCVGSRSRSSRPCASPACRSGRRARPRQALRHRCRRCCARAGGAACTDFTPDAPR